MPPTTLRRSARRGKLSKVLTSPDKSFCLIEKFIKDSPKSSNLAGNSENLNNKSPKRKPKDGLHSVEVFFSPVSPELSETEKRKRKDCSEEMNRNAVVTRSKSNTGNDKVENLKKKRVYYKKVVYDGGEFEVGDDVYVKRREDASLDEEDPEVEECRICFKAGRRVMLECDDCLGGFHLKCLKPPLKEVPEREWVCEFCEVRKLGKKIELPKPPEGKKRVRTMREKLLSSDLWAAHIQSKWKEVDGNYWCRVCCYMIPEVTVVGKQPHNLRRELYRTNDFADIEMESIIRHCSVKNPKEFAKANDEGDDVFLCEYEYDIHWHSFKHIAEIDEEELPLIRLEGEDADSDQDWKYSKAVDFDTDEDMEYEDEDAKNLHTRPSPAHELAANSRKGRFFGLQKIGRENPRACEMP